MVCIRGEMHEMRENQNAKGQDMNDWDKLVSDFDIYEDEPNDYIEPYWGDDLVKAAKTRCDQMDW